VQTCRPPPGRRDAKWGAEAGKPTRRRGREAGPPQGSVARRGGSGKPRPRTKTQTQKDQKQNCTDWRRTNCRSDRADGGADRTIGHWEPIKKREKRGKRAPSATQQRRQATSEGADGAKPGRGPRARGAAGAGEARRQRGKNVPTRPEHPVTSKGPAAAASGNPKGLGARDRSGERRQKRAAGAERCGA